MAPEGNGCCGIIGINNIINLYQYAERKIKSGLGVVTAIEGAQDKARNVQQQEDPGYDANVSDKAKAIINKGNDLKANNKMAQGGVEFADATIGTAGFCWEVLREHWGLLLQRLLLKQPLVVCKKTK